MAISGPASQFFIVDVPLDGIGPHATVVFFPDSIPMAERVVDELKTHFDRTVPPDRIVLISGEHIAPDLVALAGANSLTRNLPALTRYVGTPPVVAMTYDALGTLTACDGSTVALDVPGFRGRLLHHGLTQIFHARHGVLKAGSGFHYIKPSERHSDRFIRTGNVLLYGAEVAFIAFGLLRWLPPTIRRIYTDTASINSVGYALVALRKAVDPAFIPPSIDSYSSYGGIERLPLEDVDDAICLISASTSGGLEATVQKDYGFSRNRILTLFYVGPTQPESRILCDLTRSGDQIDGIEPISSFKGTECPYCAKGSTAVRISGDQFLPSDPQVTPVLISARHAPRGLSDTLRLLNSNGVVRVHHDRSGSTRNVREVYFHLEDIFRATSESPDDLPARLDAMLDRFLPVSLSGIIHLDDASSVAFAERLINRYETASARVFDRKALLSHSEIVRKPDLLQVKSGAVAIVASSAVSGRSLLSVSQALRRVYPHGAFVYLVGIVRSANRRAWTDVASNLAYGRSTGENPVQALLQIHLPDDRTSPGTAWDEERELLQAVLAGPTLVTEVDECRSFIEQRLKAINQAESDDVRGFQDDAFLPRLIDGTISSDRGRLLLRPGFAFWPFTWKAATQAEVFLTAAAVLHHLRDGSADMSLTQHEHSRSVIAPGCFSRFNDGVIQAALLRAARRAELDYQHDVTTSAQMREVLLLVFRNVANESGEAAPEFLLALTQRRMQLAEPDEHEIQEVLKTVSLPPFMRVLLKKWQSASR